MVTALDQPSDRVQRPEAGADDFLTKPVSDIALLRACARWSRLKMVTDELRMRAVTSREIGIQRRRSGGAEPRPAGQGRILLVDDRASSYERIAAILTAEHTVDVEAEPAAKRCSTLPKANYES